MIEIGKYNTLTILRDTKVGLFLGNPKKDPEGIHDILLPNKYVPNEFEIGEELIVFVYLDHEERPVATTLEPYILLNEFALLRVNYTNQIGAFMDWGMEKDILVPFKEQARPMEKGKRYLVYLYMDYKTNRLVASSKLNQFLKNDHLNVEKGEEVDLPKKGKKNPHFMWGKTGMVSMARKTGFVTGVAGYCYYWKASSLSLFASLQPHATDPFVAGA